MATNSVKVTLDEIGHLTEILSNHHLFSWSVTGKGFILAPLQAWRTNVHSFTLTAPEGDGVWTLRWRENGQERPKSRTGTLDSLALDAAKLLYGERLGP